MHGRLAENLVVLGLKVTKAPQYSLIASVEAPVTGTEAGSQR
jgi:hypothetical protein